MRLGRYRHNRLCLTLTAESRFPAIFHEKRNINKVDDIKKFHDLYHLFTTNHISDLIFIELDLNSCMDSQKLKTKKLQNLNKGEDSLQRNAERLSREFSSLLREINSFSFIYNNTNAEIQKRFERGIDLDEEVKNLEIKFIKLALELSNGSQVRAARLLNLKHTTLNAKIKRYGIISKVTFFIE